MELIIQLLSGAAGGNIAGKMMPKSSLGPLLNSVMGIVGGGMGGQILSALLGSAVASGGGLDVTSILSSVASGGVGGGLLMAVIGLVKKAMTK